MDIDGLLNAIPIACAFVDGRGQVAALNRGGEDLFGRAIVGRSYAAAFRRPALLGPIETAIRTLSSTQGRHEKDHGSTSVIYDVTITPMRGGGLVLAFADVTPSETAEERRAEFVANVSHELRTPLTALSGFIETLRGPARDDAAARDHFLSIMEREAQRMNRLVDDLLSLARVQDVERMRPTELIDLAQLLSTTVTSLSGLAEEGEASLRLAGSAADAMAPGDWDQLTQVFSNLIENAIKYGGKGTDVTVTLTPLKDEPLLRGPGYRIDVTDTGAGIEDHHLGRLTERFYRVDTHRSRGMGGTGLGLAIVKHIVSRHRGHLRIHSEVGKGSTFTIFLPKG